jgi:hypothetical protein
MTYCRVCGMIVDPDEFVRHDAAIRNAALDDFARWVKTEWVQESIKDYKEELHTKEQP